MNLLNETRDSIDVNELSTSLRLSKYASLGVPGVDAFQGIEKWKQRPRPLNLNFSESREIYMKLEDRLILNQSGGVMENANLCVDRNFGCPYIPGSAIKGSARHAAWEIWTASDENAKPEMAVKIAETFGFPTNDEKLDAYLATIDADRFSSKASSQGCVSFLPAYPVKPAPLEVDVLTCHHMNYYSGKTAVATDDENPNPQFFPAVKAGAVFRFVLVRLCGDSHHLQFAETNLLRALVENGIGAKTAAGYGWFSRDHSFQEMMDREKEKARRELEQNRARELAEREGLKRREANKKREFEAEQKRIADQEARDRALAEATPEDRFRLQFSEASKDAFAKRLRTLEDDPECIQRIAFELFELRNPRNQKKILKDKKALKAMTSVAKKLGINL